MFKDNNVVGVDVKKTPDNYISGIGKVKEIPFKDVGAKLMEGGTIVAFTYDESGKHIVCRGFFIKNNTLYDVMLGTDGSSALINIEIASDETYRDFGVVMQKMFKQAYEAPDLAIDTERISIPDSELGTFAKSILTGERTIE